MMLDGIKFEGKEVPDDDTVAHSGSATGAAFQRGAAMTAPVASIARIWKGRTSIDQADAYEAYLRETGIPPLERTALGVTMLRRDSGRETTFVTISWWESVPAMARFTGASPTRIHNLPRDPEFLLSMPRRVEVFDVRSEQGRRSLGAVR
jgi:hypothetical protein